MLPHSHIIMPRADIMGRVARIHAIARALSGPRRILDRAVDVQHLRYDRDQR
jgi:hypothetical protein